MGKTGKNFKTNYIKNPHDSYFMDAFTNKENITTFFKTVLPQEILESIDLTDIEYDLKSYLNEKLNKRISDLVVKTTVSTDKKKDEKLATDIYFLFEHKSYKDNSILLQLLRYMFLMWQKDAADKKPLRIILPIVFYHGKTGWTIPTSFVNQFCVSKDIKKHLLNFTYVLFDTKDMMEVEKYKKLTENIKLTAQILLMKNIFEKETDKLEEVLKFWYKNGLVSDKNFLEKSLTYIMFTRDYSQEEIIDLLERNKIGGEDIMPSLGQRLINKGRDEGLQQGIQQGVQQGMQQGLSKGKIEERKELVKKMHTEGMKIRDISRFTGLSKNEIEEIIKTG
jgi:predicted transposase/invertase (TIGR01784 family)